MKSYTLKSLFPWCFSCFKNEKKWTAISYFSGFISAIWTIPLAYDFGTILVSKDILNIASHEFSVWLGIIFMSLSFPASVMLFGRTTNNIIIRSIARRELRSNEKKQFREYFFDSCVWFAAMINAIPPTYLTYFFLRSHLGGYAMIFILITYISSVARNVWSLSNLAEIIFLKMLKYFYYFKKTILRDCPSLVEIRLFLMKIESFVENAPIKKIIPQLNNITLKNSDSMMSASQVQEQFKEFVDLDRQLHESVGEYKVKIMPVVLGFLGAVVGGVATWPFYKFAHDGAVLVFPYSQFGIFCGVASVLFTGSLYLYSSFNTFKIRLYPVLTSKHKTSWNPKILFVLLISFCGAGPLTMMTYRSLNLHNKYSYFIILCAFVCAFATKIWAIYGSLDKNVHQDAGEKARKNVLFTLKKLTRTLGVLKKAQLDGLCNFVKIH
ncbi:MAG: hypothetical protein K0U29_05715 [Gammaproteobacteria bacterium]|nr:hypothetical protein [Gammaproteobacteria bacterium]